ncbi:polyphosphate--nucleotide phosphotransferase [Microlunatus endophyticus]|uniref:Polyphosphate--nucleotide phosphotransferase n=1 Tax=Microlunatus endophyticus TaxID=1716077 RepID=A0A917S6M0_9ACTN|nr:PPK2 family polyphosphate kinase [Microlunatus endophyticus]GGL57331.1 polyphosphate--nucleotide phosphotransferase [Microlunatus endophyticus]
MPKKSSSTKNLRSALRIDPEDGVVDLADYSPRKITTGPDSRKASLAALEDLGAELVDLQTRLYADGVAGEQRSVLLVLQGMDTSGKSGVIDHVVGLVGPEGTHIRAFKKPTEEERAHDFLWRIKRELPGPGMIGVFDRSHYEDVLVTVVHDQIDDAERLRRYRTINEFEAGLVAAGTTVIKCFLNISYDEQRERLLARLDDETKNWKFNVDDITERRMWPEYQKAYAEALAATSTEVAPWYAIPSDRKWYRNWAVGVLLRDTLRDLDPRYPKTDLDIPQLKRRLAPPN